MKEFKVVTTPRQDRLEQQVTDSLNDGWVIEGPITTANTGAFALCMVRDVKTATPKAAKVEQPKAKPETKTKKLGDGI